MTAKTFNFSIAASVTALETFAATLSAGAFAQFTLPSLASNAATGSYPFDAPAAAVAASIGAVHMLDWAVMMDSDPATKRWYIAGGRPYTSTLPTKMVIFDEAANEVRALDQWSGGQCGHIYRSTTVIPEHRRVVYFPLGDSLARMLDIDTETYAGSISKPPTNIGGFTSGWQGNNFVCWFPGFGTQGAIIFVNLSGGRIVKFDWASQTWSAVGNHNGLWNNQHISGHCHPITGKMIFGCSYASDQKALVILDSSGTTNTTAVPPCDVACASSAQFFPHPTRDASIVTCTTTNKIWSYEWSSNTWVDRGALPAALDNANVIAAPTSWGALFFVYGASGNTKAYAWKPNF